MTPTPFPQANKLYTAPLDWDEDKHGPCGNLHVYNDGTHLISRWQLTEGERKLIAEGAPIWLFITGQVQPPVGFVVKRDIFETDNT